MKIETTTPRVRTDPTNPPAGLSDAGHIPRTRHIVPVIGLVALLLNFIGLGGIGDAPAPHDEPSSMAAHFELVRDGIFITAPFGILGAAATVAFMLALARRLHARGESMSAAALVTGGLLAACYLIAIQVVYTSLADGAAASSPEATKALFVPTILAAPVFGLGTSVALGGAAFGATRARLQPRWWSVMSVVAAIVAAIAIFSYADSNFFSPDVQQQTAFGALQLWLLVTSITMLLRGRRENRSDGQFT